MLRYRNRNIARNYHCVSCKVESRKSDCAHTSHLCVCVLCLIVKIYLRNVGTANENIVRTTPFFSTLNRERIGVNCIDSGTDGIASPKLRISTHEGGSKSTCSNQGCLFDAVTLKE